MEFLQLDTDKLTSSAVIKTNLGEMTLALFPEQAPKAVENFRSEERRVGKEC